MKFLYCFTLIAVSLFNYANAQEYKKLKVELTMGLFKSGLPYLPLSIGGFYGITDNYMAGYRIDSGPGSPKGLIAHSFIGRYYFDFKPHSRMFIGLGPGIYLTQSSNHFTGSTTTTTLLSSGEWAPWHNSGLITGI